MSDELAPVYIYGLVDPRSNELRYIGKTIDLGQRYRDHLKDKTTGHRGNWLRSLKRAGVKPVMVEIEQTDQENWAAAERFYIAFFRHAGCNLINSTDGGDDGWSHLPEVRKKISENSGSRRPEVKAKISAHNHMRLSAESRAHHSQKMKEFYRNNPDARKQKAEALAGIRPPRKPRQLSLGLRVGHPHTEESRRKIREAQQRRFTDPVERIKQSQRSSGRKMSAETRSKLSRSRKGIEPWNKGKKGLQTGWNKGLHYSNPKLSGENSPSKRPEVRAKLSEKARNRNMLRNEDGQFLSTENPEKNK